MAFNFDSLNKKSTVKDGVETDNMMFVPLKSFQGKEIHVDGFFFTEGKYGEQVVVVGEGYLINMPKRAVEPFKGIAENSEALNDLLAGHLAISDIKPMETRNGSTTIYKFKTV